ncbi:tyrosine-type recombinase/integrase [Palleronia sp. LCG004]|uniref:tyrosine-type recombinase/integrase n=1 Tax=Palleronia sp. LCG004 TaxID=3079304 RepID=UPI003978151B
MGYTGKAVLPFFGAYEPSAITRQMCRDYAAQRGAKGISQGTVWTELGHLSSAIKFAYASKLIEADTKIWRPQKPDHDFRILDRGEARALIEGTRDPHMRLAIVLLLGTAARVGAILDLTWDRVNLETGVINLRLPDSTTRKGRAVVPMNGSTRAALTAAYDAALTDYVIEYAGHQVKCIRTGFKAAARRAGIGDLRIHDLRHTAAVTMLSQGTPIEKVSQVLGHSSTAVTQKVYARYLPHHMQDATNLLDFSSIRRA